ncbi:MAG: bifunctional diaminohydroxyphosphoribosylaminopyrimidine deaminase/5-amino-6-(5-phosphoribosylamino)uracil reductase RibD [Hydrogenothermaceae bacterium]
MYLDKKFMGLALKLAEKRKGYTHPNPTVGAVIVKDGKVIGRGYHLKAVMPHGEREAIRDAKSKGYDLTGSTMYVTLEPCCHYGRTPPCTEAIIEEGISRVVVATLDPNPLVAGKGIEILKNKGIEVEVGVLEREAKRLNEDFFTYITKKRPFIHLKIAQTLDGKIATKTGSSRWITSEKSRKYVHILRREATAILVGKNTVLCDNPSLTVRDVKTEKQPIRVIIDKNLSIPTSYNIFNPDAPVFLIAEETVDKNKIKERENLKNVKVITLPLNREGKFSLRDILRSLYNEGVVHLLVEGGKGVFTDFIRENLWDKISLFVAPKLIGEDGIDVIGDLGILDINDAKTFSINRFKKLGDDILFEIYRESDV